MVDLFILCVVFGSGCVWCFSIMMFSLGKVLCSCSVRYSLVSLLLRIIVLCVVLFMFILYWSLF